MKKIITYFKMKRLERQMKYELLSHLYLFVSGKEDYITLFSKLAAEAAHSDSNELLEKLVRGMAETTQPKSAKNETVSEESAL